MKVTPQSAVPSAVTAKTSTQTSSTARAIAAFNAASQAPNKQPEAQTPVKNANQVQPEELSAIKASSQPAQSTQSDNIEPTQQVDAQEATDAPPAPAKVEEKEDPLSTQYALLARKEKALRAKVQAQESAAKAREEALLAREEAIKAKESDYSSNYIQKSRLKSDPLSVLAEEGVSYEELTKAILSPQVQQDPRLLAELEKIKEEVRQAREQQELNKKSYEDQQKQAYNQAVSQIRNEVTRLVTTDPDFETIKETGSVNDVVELIEKTFQSEGVLLSVEDAAKEVEEYLVDEALKLARITKIKNRLQPVEKPVQKQQQSTVPAKQQQPMKTLTNSIGTSPKLNAKQRAMLAFEGKLK